MFVPQRVGLSHTLSLFTHTHTHTSKIFISYLIETVYGSPWQTHTLIQTHVHTVTQWEKARGTDFIWQSNSPASFLSQPWGLLFPHFPTDVSFNDAVLIYCPPHDSETEWKMLKKGQKDIEPGKRDRNWKMLLMFPNGLLLLFSSSELDCIYFLSMYGV